MKHYKWFALIVTCVGILALAVIMAGAQDNGEPDTGEIDSVQDATELSAVVGSGFTYQGRLERDGNPVTGMCDMDFRLYDVASGGNQVGSPVVQAVQVNRGLFTTTLNFGAGPFQGEARWLEIRVRCPAGSGEFTLLGPREALTAVPYALGLRPGTIVRSSEPDGIGIAGQALSETDTFATGVDGISYALRGRGLRGRAMADSGPAAGVLGRSRSTEGRGVVGEAVAASGQNYGVLGITTSPDGYGGRFVNNGASAGSGAGLYARGSGGSAPDIVLGTDGGSGGPEDDAVIASDTSNIWSDFIVEGQDKVIVRVGANGQGDPGSNFRVSGPNGVILLVSPDGVVSVPVLQITGGADLSEQFDVGSNQPALQPEPGMVVSIDTENPGQLVVSSKSYDRTVAGIISGAGGVETGMVMGHDGTVADGDYPVALSGRVYVWADASYSAIQPGDLLTTSATPGYAMKVTNHTQAQGAILGKAMTSLEEGRGLVLVLVALQ